MPKIYPEVLKDRPGLERDIKIVDHMATVLQEGDFLSIITNPSSGTANIHGLIKYDSVFKPDIEVPEVLADFKLEKCLTLRDVLEECLPDNWRHTAKQRLEALDLIVSSVRRWERLSGALENVVDDDEEEIPY